MTGDGTNDAPALAQADVGVAMNTGTQAAKEAGNMVDLDSNPTKLIEIVEIGKQLLITRGSLTTFSIANDVAKYFAIIPAMFVGVFPQLDTLNVMDLDSPRSAILSAVIFNALIIVGADPAGPAGREVPGRSARRRCCAATCSIYGARRPRRPVRRHQAHRPRHHRPGSELTCERQLLAALRTLLVLHRPARPRLPAGRHRRRPGRLRRRGRRLAGRARRRGRRARRCSARRSPATSTSTPGRRPPARRLGLRVDVLDDAGEPTGEPSRPTRRPVDRQRRAPRTSGRPTRTSSPPSRSGSPPTARPTASPPTPRVPVDAVTASGSGLDPHISVRQRPPPGRPGGRGPGPRRRRRARPRRRAHRRPGPRLPRRAGRERARAEPRPRRASGADAAEAVDAGGGRAATLRIYLGAAPGVGKTFAMLNEGRRRRRAGHRRRRRLRRDPRPGPHRRADRRPRGRAPPAGSSTAAPTFEEMDVDAVLARRPERGAGRRAGPHQRPRVAATRSAGRTSRSCSTPASTSISTVNIQHLESLNDVVERITGVAPARDGPRRGRAGAPTRSSWST